MGGSIKTVILLFIALGISSFGFTQGVINVAFDEGGTNNSTSNALEVEGAYYFLQNNYRNNKVFLEAVKLNQQGQEEKKEVIASHSSLNIFYGFSGSLQYLSTNEFCQLYHIALDSAVQLVFFDTNFNVKRTVRYDFNYFLNPGIVRQINDSTLLTLGRVQNASTFDLFIINTDLQGNERWRTSFGEPGKNDYGYAIEIVNDMIVVGGQTYQTSTLPNPHLFVFNSMGQQTFDTIYQDYNNGGFLGFEEDYGLYLGCSINVPGGAHPALVRLTADFTIDWGKRYFQNGLNYSFSGMTINNEGTITIAGSNWEVNQISGLFFQTNHLGDSLGSKLIHHTPGERAQFHDIRPTSDGGYIMAGETHVPGQDSWIVKVNAWGCDNIPCIVGVNEPEISKGELKCYPNPSNGRGVISGSLTKFTGHTEIKVFNTLGQLVQTIPVTQKDFEVEVNLTQKGLYLVNLYQGNELVQSKKWVVR